MTSLNISLPEALKQYVEGQVATGDGGTPSVEQRIGTPLNLDKHCGGDGKSGNVCSEPCDAPVLQLAVHARSSRLSFTMFEDYR